MKKILALVLLLPSLAFADGWQIPYPAGTPRAFPTPGTPMERANVTVYGDQRVTSVDGGGSGLFQSVIPVSNATSLNGVGAGVVGWTLIAADAVEAASTTTVLNLTAHVARVGDAIFSQTGTAANQKAWSVVSAVTANTVTLSNALPATPTAADQVLIFRPVLIAASGAPSGQSGTALMVNIDSGYQNATGNGILKLEDAAAASGDALVAIGAEATSAAPAGKVASGDYVVPTYDTAGRAWGVANYLEDAAIGGANPTILSGAQTQDPLSVDQDASGDAAYMKVDRVGRTITTLAPAGESFQACSSANTGTSDIAIKAAVASNRIYVTEISCGNNSAVASIVSFKDGATTMSVGGIGTLAATGGNYYATFPVPLRGTVNTALNFAMATTATSTTCCASGYISVN